MRRDSERTPEAIEEDIARTRADIDSTLNAIESRFTPGQMLDQGLDYLRHSGANEFLTNLRGSVKYNPLPVSLVGVGIAWLMLADKSQRRPMDEDLASDRGSSIREGVEAIERSGASVRQKVSEAAHTAHERASAVGEGARHIGEGARHQWQRARQGYEHTLREQPLALGAVGLAVGALLAAVMPRTREEDELMGETRDRLAKEAMTAAKEQGQKVEHVAAAAGEAASEAAHREGLTGSQPSHSSESARSGPAETQSGVEQAAPR